MEHKQLSNGAAMPMLGLGTSALRGAACRRAVRRALALGYAHLDTAESYGNEADIGAAIAPCKREQLFLTSKVWRERPLTHDDVIAACHGSLRRLGVERLDLYLIHWPNRRTAYRAVFEAFARLLDEGLIRALGVSNFTAAHLDETLPLCDELGLKVAVNQVEFHVGLYQEALLARCDRHGIAVTAYSPLRKGDLGHPTLARLGARYGKTPAQVALRWLLQRGAAAIPKAGRPEHQAANLDVFDFALAPDELRQLDALGAAQRLVRPAWAEFDAD